MCARWLSAADWRARRRSCRGAAHPPMAAPRGHVTHPAPADACLQIIIIRRGRCGAARSVASSTSYAQLSLHLAGFDSVRTERELEASICLLGAFAAYYRSLRNFAMRLSENTRNLGRRVSKFLTPGSFAWLYPKCFLFLLQKY